MANLLVVAVDTGNKNIKTPHTEPFNSGLICHGNIPPAIKADTLCYEGNYYARTLIRTLKEKGVDLTLSYPVFIGGGSCLMRPVIESELGRDDYLFVEDPRANAVGFKMMAESKLAAENR